MLYPTFEFAENRYTWFPKINLPENYKELVPKFYKQKREKTIRKYTKMIKETLVKKIEITLRWDNKKGLTNINIGPEGGLDLNENFGYPHFCEHNLGTETSFISGIIAMKYISELLKSK